MAHRSSVKDTEDLCTITCIILSCVDERGILLSYMDGRKFMREGDLLLQRPIRVHESEMVRVDVIQTTCLGEGWRGEGSTFSLARCRLVDGT